MSFSALVDYVGVDRQTPGFIGHSGKYIISRKYLQGEGGLARLIWMPKKLKESLGSTLYKASALYGLGSDFPDKIADEQIGRTIEDILPFLMEKRHPALTMKPLL